MLTLPREIHTVIISLLNLAPVSPKPDIRSIGRLAAACKYFNKLIDINSDSTIFIRDRREKTRRERILRLRTYNPFKVIFDNCQDMRFYHLMTHECITFDMVKSRGPGIDIHIALNPNITIDMLLELIMLNIIKPNVKFALSAQSVITIDELEMNGLIFDPQESIEMLTFQKCLQYKLSSTMIHLRAKLYITDIINNPHFSWQYDKLIFNNHFSAADLFAIRNYLKITKVYTTELIIYCNDRVYGPKYEALFMEKYKKLPDNFVHLCSSHFSFNTMLKYKDVNWNWRVLSRRLTHIPIEHKLKTSHLPWSLEDAIINIAVNSPEWQHCLKFQKLHDSGELTIDIVKNNPHIEWSWTNLVKYDGISVDDLLAYGPQTESFVILLGQHRKITPQHVIKYQHIDWDYALKTAKFIFFPAPL